MKKTLYLSMGLLILVNISKAQQTSFGFTAGLTFPSYKATEETVSITSKTKVGFTAGITSSTRLGQNFSFQPALNFVQKGGTFKMNGISDKITLNYVELPLNVVYNTSSSAGKFFIGAGPSLSMGISGKEKYDDGTAPPQTSKIKFGKGDEDDFKTLDAGINFLAGYQLGSGLLIAANYYAGLSNIVETAQNENGKLRNRYFAFRIGYMFGNK